MPDDPELSLYPYMTHNGEFLVVYTGRGTDRRSGIHIRANCCNPAYDGGFREIFEPGVAEYSVIDDPMIKTDEGDKAMLVFLTNRDAPAGRLVLVDPMKPEPEHWKTLVAEPTESGMQIEAVVRAGDRYVVNYMKDATQRTAALRPAGWRRAGDRAADGRHGGGHRCRSVARRHLLRLHELHLPDDAVPSRPEDG